MRPLGLVGIRWLILAEICFLFGCGNAATVLDLKTDDPMQDQRKIAEFYTQEATRLRQMAHDQFHRAAVYERLFGPESDWVEGARLLAQSYEDAAQEQERTAERHRDLVQHGRPSQAGRIPAE
jgi:hypothetical protein